MAKEYTYEDFLDIIKTLRSENGCPWDRKQTHESLRPCMMEEAAEAVAAIRIWKETGNAENLREELGDVLLQVVMHACIAEEEGIFTMAEVVNEIAEKMVRRHPHVFGSTEVESSAEVLQNWDEIKKQEKEGKSWIESPLREIPRELPALTRAPKVIKKADKYYGRPRSRQADIAVLKKAVEILENSDEKQMEQCVEKELGDILMAVSDLASLYKKPLEQLLTDKIDDLIDNCEREMP
ncbi:MAG: MazG family protein [Lachnospiraceae bacterium]|nr:MazG family protein [Lachnospiraceae bacterium]